MAAFGNLSFSRVIRTILPGILLAVILGCYVDSMAWLANGETPVLDAVPSQPAIVLGAGVLLALVAGNFSNMVVFAWLSPRLIWQPFEVSHDNAGILETEDQLRCVLVERISDQLGVTDLELLDLDYLAIPFVDLDKWIHLEEDFWYHLEFQMNSLLGLVVGLPIALFLSVRAAVWLGLNWLCAVIGAILVIVVIAVSALLWLRAARLNFKLYRMKRVSQIASSVAFSVPGMLSRPDE